MCPWTRDACCVCQETKFACAAVIDDSRVLEFAVQLLEGTFAHMTTQTSNAKTPKLVAVLIILRTE